MEGDGSVAAPGQPKAGLHGKYPNIFLKVALRGSGVGGGRDTREGSNQHLSLGTGQSGHLESQMTRRGRSCGLNEGAAARPGGALPCACVFRARSAAQPVRFDTSNLHTLQTLVLKLQVVCVLEEVAVS